MLRILIAAASLSLSQSTLSQDVCTKVSIECLTDCSKQAGACGLLSDRPEAFAAWMVLAEKGNPSAELVVGTAYALGKGVPRDENRAIAWLRKAAEAGNTTAQYNLSLLHIARGEFADGFEWSAVAARRASGPLQMEAQRHSQLAVFGVRGDTLDKVQRSIADWLEELPEPDSTNNLAADEHLAFARIARLPADRGLGFGWKATTEWIQTSAQANLRAGKMFR